MKEQLQSLIEQKISEWQRDGIYENIYAISLYVFNEEDDPRRPVAVLGYNTEHQAWQSIPLASDEQEARWNYAFWLQNEELCWGLGDTAEAVRQWIAEQDLEDEEEIAAQVYRDRGETHSVWLLGGGCNRHRTDADRRTRSGAEYCCSSFGE